MSDPVVNASLAEHLRRIKALEARCAGFSEVIARIQKKQGLNKDKRAWNSLIGQIDGRVCGYCGEPLRRKRVGRGSEPTKSWLQRKFCDQSCAAYNRYRKGGLTRDENGVIRKVAAE